MKGGVLAITAGHHVNRSIRMDFFPVHIPECQSYTVEYRLCETGEFEVSRDENGKTGVRSLLGLRPRFPVCWLPRSFVGKRVDRYILMVDRKRVSCRAGVAYRRAA